MKAVTDMEKTQQKPVKADIAGNDETEGSADAVNGEQVAE